MANQVRVADCTDGRLSLVVTSGVLSTRLRYQHADIRRTLAQKLRLGVDEVEVLVRPEYHRPAPKPPERQLSERARKHLAETARHIDDERLAEALRRLSRCGS